MDKNAIEAQIRDVLNNESDAITLSNKLFSPNGLFNQLAEKPADRKTLTQSVLFKEAQKRLAELRRKEATEFAKAVDESARTLGEARLHKLEGV